MYLPCSLRLLTYRKTLPNRPRIQAVCRTSSCPGKTSWVNRVCRRRLFRPDKLAPRCTRRPLRSLVECEPRTGTTRPWWTGLAPNLPTPTARTSSGTDAARSRSSVRRRVAATTGYRSRCMPPSTILGSASCWLACSVCGRSARPAMAIRRTCRTLV